MSVQPLSFMSTKPSDAIVKKAAKEAKVLKEKAIYYGKEPMGEVKVSVPEKFRAQDLESYVNSRQPINKIDNDVSADEIAKAYRASKGIPEPKNS